MQTLLSSLLERLASVIAIAHQQPLVAAGAFIAVGSITGVATFAFTAQESLPPVATPGQQQDVYERIPNDEPAAPNKVSSDKPVAPSTAGAAASTIAKQAASGGSTNPTTEPTQSTQAPQAPVSGPTNPPTPVPAPQTMPHISRSGTKLMRSGAEYKFAGINADTWFGCWANEADATNEANLQRYFGELHRNSMTRIWPYANTDWEETMDRVVRIAEEHGQYLMVTLSDANDNGYQCGSNKGTAYPADGGVVKAHAQEIVARYKNSPAIAVWEICNECSRNSANKPWYVSIAQAIKAIDSTTLVATGAGTCYQTTWQNCVDVDDFPENDLVSMHEYDYNNGGVSHWADETQNIAAQLGKPWFSGESGFTGGGRPTGLTTGNFGFHLTTEWNSYLNATGSAGMLYWDMKWTYDFEDTINVGGRGWDAARTFTHQWQGN